MDHFEPQTVGAVRVKRKRRLRRKGTVTRHRMKKKKAVGPEPGAKARCNALEAPTATHDEQLGSSTVQANFKALGVPLPFSVLLWLADDDM